MSLYLLIKSQTFLQITMFIFPINSFLVRPFVIFQLCSSGTLVTLLNCDLEPCVSKDYQQLKLPPIPDDETSSPPSVITMQLDNTSDTAQKKYRL